MDNSRLEKVLKSGEEINLGNLFDWLQGIAEELGKVVRWKDREKIAGQSVRENDLQHIFKATLLTIVCAISENSIRSPADQLDVGELSIMAIGHDLGEIIEGDGPHYQKVDNNRKKDVNELAAFRRIVSPLPQEVQERLIYAVRQTLPGCGEYIDTKEARFFNAVEQLLGLKRGLYECSLGNLHFAPKCLDWHIAGLQKHSDEFVSLMKWYYPYIEETKSYLMEFAKQRDKYITESVKRGGRKEEFPF